MIGWHSGGMGDKLTQVAVPAAFVTYTTPETSVAASSLGPF